MDYSESLAKKGITVSGGDEKSLETIWKIVKDFPKVDGMKIEFVPKEQMTFQNEKDFSPMEASENTIRIYKDAFKKGPAERFGNNVYSISDALAHEYGHIYYNGNEEARDSFRKMYFGGNYDSVLEDHPFLKNLSPEEVLNEHFAEGFKYYALHPDQEREEGNRFYRNIFDEKFDQPEQYEYDGNTYSAFPIRNEGYGYDKSIMKNLYSRRSDLQELFDEKGSVKNPSDKRTAGLKDFNDWYSQYGESEYYNHLGANREDLKRIYDKKGNIISKNSQMAKDIPTIKDWWQKYGKMETGQYLENEAKNKVSANDNLPTFSLLNKEELPTFSLSNKNNI